MNASNKKYTRSEFFSFFLDRVRQKSKLIYPPYSIDEDNFSNICPDCSGRCVVVCPQQIIERNQKRIPYLDFSTDGCTFCGACAEACEPGVLNQGQPNLIFGDIHLDFNSCLAWNDTICQSCKDVCPEDAIFFEGIKNPNIRKDVCTRCGLCLSVCPTESIQISKFKYDE